MLEKNIKKLNDKKQRCLEPMNTGTRNMKSNKDYDRKKSKLEIKKLFNS